MHGFRIMRSNRLYNYLSVQNFVFHFIGYYEPTIEINTKNYWFYQKISKVCIQTTALTGVITGGGVEK